MWLFLIVFLPTSFAVRGLYGTWVNDCEIVELVSDIQGLGTVVQWAKLEPEDGKFNFSAIDESSNCGLKYTTFQVNANEHPTYMFDVLPTTAPWGDPEDSDSKYIMYYHPSFVSRMNRMVAVTANYLAGGNTSLPSIAVVRQNWDAIGTEHFDIPSNLTDPKHWNYPEGVPLGPEFIPSQTVSEYEEKVFPEYLDGYLGSSAPSLYVRNDLIFNPALFPKYDAYFRNGTLKWFHTSSELEPRSQNVAERYLVFRNYCAPGLTDCYAEPWADGWGHPDDDRWTTPPAWLWWRILSDLTNGVSHLAMYGSDLEVAAYGTHDGMDVGVQYKQEFGACASMAARYAPFVASPQTTPGAFVAFRYSTFDIPYNKIVQDYNFLVDVQNPNSLPFLDARTNGSQVPIVQNRTRQGMKTLGDPTSRFGAWARPLTTSSPSIDLVFNQTLIQRANAQSTVDFCLTFLDSTVWPPSTPSTTTATINIDAGAAPPYQTPVANSKIWKTIRATVPTPLKPKTTISITSSNSNIITAIHMAELLIDTTLLCSAQL